MKSDEMKNTSTKSRQVLYLTISLVGLGMSSWVSNIGQTSIMLFIADVLQGVFLISTVVILIKIIRKNMSQKRTAREKQ